MDTRKVLAALTAVVLVMFMACGGETPREEPEADGAAVEPEVVDTAEDDAEPEMTDEEKMAYVMENCICPQCPSWIPEAAEKGEGGYCATGKSECIVVEAGCICPECPVTEEMGLEWGYYCTRGSAAEMMEAEAEADGA